jgi:hypothetical protein
MKTNYYTISLNQRKIEFLPIREEYPFNGCVVIYEVSFIENEDIFFYIGSHKCKIRDDYYGSTPKLIEMKKNKYPISFRILEISNNENRYFLEGDYIKEYKKSYQKNCINRLLDPENHLKGWDHWDDIQREKFNKTCQEEFGGHPFKDENIKQKIKKTIKERYKVNHHLQNPNILKKQKETNLKKYGCENISQLEEIKEKKKKTYAKNHNGQSYHFTISANDVLTPEDRKRIGQKAALKNKGKKWFNNGIKSTQAFECPIGFQPGRIKFR